MIRNNKLRAKIEKHVDSYILQKGCAPTYSNIQKKFKLQNQFSAFSYCSDFREKMNLSKTPAIKIKAVSSEGKLLGTFDSIHQFINHFNLSRLSSSQLIYLSNGELLKVKDYHICLASKSHRKLFLEMSSKLNIVTTQKEKLKLKQTYNSQKKKLHNSILILNRDFEIMEIWRGSLVDLAIARNINKGTLKASCSKFKKYKRDYISLKKRRENSVYFCHLKDY